jgi:hypothetical protein
MHKPHNGQIVIIPEGDKYVHADFFLLVWTVLVLELANPFMQYFVLWGSQFHYANYSIDDKMKKGPILGVVLKQEYPRLLKGPREIVVHSNIMQASGSTTHTF